MPSPGCSILCDDGARLLRAAFSGADEINLPPLEGKGHMTADAKEDVL
jgi:hypothetical protein